MRCFFEIQKFCSAFAYCGSLFHRVAPLKRTNLYIKYAKCWSLRSKDIAITSFFGLWSLETSNDLWPPPTTLGFFLSTWQIYIPNMKSVGLSYLEIACLQAIFGVFADFPLVTSNDLWPPPTTIGFFCSTWQMHIPNMKSVGHCYL